MPSLPRAPACSCNGEAPPGGEGILPSHAPPGAHGQSIFEAMRLAAHSEGKMRSPPRTRPLAVGARRPLVPCRKRRSFGGKAFCLPCRASALNSLRPEGSAPVGAQGRHSAFPGARKRAQLVATGRRCACRRTGKAECLPQRGQRALAMARGPLGARASCPRTRRQARMASRSSKRCALRRMARARCRQDALAPRGPSDGCRARRPLVSMST